MARWQDEVATKGYVKQVMENLRIDFKKDLRDMAHLLEDRFDAKLNEKLAQFVTKKEFSALMTTLDEFVTELRDSRLERQLSEHQTMRMDDQIVDHEKRIGSLEERFREHLARLQ